MFPNQFAKQGSWTKNFNWSGLLDGTQKTLGIINQAIPIIYQVKPILGNAKTMFRIADALNSTTTGNNNYASDANIEPKKSVQTNLNKPIFYI